MHTTYCDNDATCLKMSLIKQNRYLIHRILCWGQQQICIRYDGICFSRIRLPGSEVHQTFPCRIIINVRRWGRSAASVPSWYWLSRSHFFSAMRLAVSVAWKASLSMLSIFFAAYRASPRASIDEEYQSSMLRIKTPITNRHIAASIVNGTLRILISCGEKWTR